MELTATARFGGAVPAAAAVLLERARAAWHDPAAATALLGEALALAPDCLALHYARYNSTAAMASTHWPTRPPARH